MENKGFTKAMAYYRTSSATNVGADKDSERRQQEAVGQFADRNGYRVVGAYYDAAVSGADPVDERPEFVRMLEDMERLGVKAVLVENAGRFARDLAVQLNGYDMLKEMGIALVPVDAPDYFTNASPTAVLVRQILGAIMEFDRVTTTKRMHAARERQRGTGKGGLVDERVRARARLLRAEGQSFRTVARVLEREYGWRGDGRGVKSMIEAWGGR